jgi:MinD-like ATPase involved in chromosome partitioning or flagellar assembly
VAINLALAQGEDATEAVLVVDGNFGQPMLSRLVGASPPECFARQIRENAELSDDDATWSAMSVGFEHVHVLAIDPESDLSTRRFDPPAFRAALSALKNGPYRYVFVDLPPPLRSSGFNLAGDVVDGVVLTGVARTTRAKHMRLAAERLLPVPVVATVLFR